MSITTNLLRHGDFNVPITIFDLNPRFYQHEVYYNHWIETIQKAIGDAIVKSKKTYLVTSTVFETVFSHYCTGSELVNSIRRNCKKVASIRIEVVDDNDNEQAWIILVSDKDLDTPE